MSLILVVRALHLLGAMVMLGGVLARQIVRREASRSTDVRRFAALTDASRQLDRFMVIPGTLVVGVFGVLLAFMIGAPLFGFLQSASRNWLLVAIVLMLLGAALVPTVFLPQRQRIEAALQSALIEDRITPDLRTAVSNPAAKTWHLVEVLAVVAIMLLMVLRPF